MATSAPASVVPSVDLLVVNHNGGRWWPGFCDSLARLDYPAERLRLMVVDNASRDGSVAQLRALAARLPFPTEIVETGVNGGFAGGYEVAFGHARGDYWFVVNQDTRIAPDAIRKLVAVLEGDPEAGVAEARQSPREHPKYYDPFTRETSWCSGACMLLRPAAVAAAGGGFDRRFFMYAEDVDLSWRLWRHGWKCLYVPEAVVEHFTEDLDPERKPTLQHYYSMRNGAAMRVAHGTFGQAVLHYAAMLRIAAWSHNPRWHRWGTFKAAVASLRLVPAALAKRWRMRKRPSSPWVSFNGWEYGRCLKDLSLEPVAAAVPAISASAAPTGEILISVVVPTHNRAGGLRRVAERLLRQEGFAGGYEVILCDSASSDGTPAACAELARDPRVRTCRVERPGAAAARNAGLDRARGRLVVMMDDDILVRRDFLAALWRAHQRRPGNVLLTKIVAPWGDLVDPFLRYMLAAQEVNIYNFPDPENVPADYFFTGCVAAPRAAVGAVRFDENFTVYGVEDIEFGVRMLDRRARMVFLPEVEVWHEYYPTASYFIRKRTHSGYSLGYFLEKSPERAGQYVFENWVKRWHRWIGVGVWLTTPAAKALELAERARYSNRPVNNWLRVWYRAAIRVGLYHGLLTYRKPGRTESALPSLAARATVAGPLAAAPARNAA